MITDIGMCRSKWPQILFRILLKKKITFTEIAWYVHDFVFGHRADISKTDDTVSGNTLVGHSP